MPTDWPAASRLLKKGGVRHEPPTCPQGGPARLAIDVPVVGPAHSNIPVTGACAYAREEWSQAKSGRNLNSARHASASGAARSTVAWAGSVESRGSFVAPRCRNG
jgi:hypothetical protein